MLITAECGLYSTHQTMHMPFCPCCYWNVRCFHMRNCIEFQWELPQGEWHKKELRYQAQQVLHIMLNILPLSSVNLAMENLCSGYTHRDTLPTPKAFSEFSAKCNVWPNKIAICCLAAHLSVALLVSSPKYESWFPASFSWQSLLLDQTASKLQELFHKSMKILGNWEVQHEIIKPTEQCRIGRICEVVDSFLDYSKGSNIHKQKIISSS